MAEGTVHDLPPVSDNGTRVYTPLKAVKICYNSDDDTMYDDDQNFWTENNEDWNDHDTFQDWTRSESNTTVNIAPSSYAQSSQPFSNQQFFSLLDGKLDTLPRDLYIERLLKETDNDEGTISMYRTLLASRAQRFENCPQGQLMTRRTTSTGTVAEKFASDCYCLYNFICNGDPKAVSDTFCKRRNTKSDTPKKGSQPSSRVRTFECEIAELKSSINLLKQELSDIKNNLQRTRSALRISSRN